MIALSVLRYWKTAVVVAMLVVAGWAGHHIGYSSADDAWSAKWTKRNSADNDAKIAAQANALAEDSRRTKLLGEIQNDAQKRIANATRAAADSAAAADRLHREARELASAIDRGDSAAIDRISKTGRTPVSLYADLFRRADDRAGELAAIADRAIERGLTCQAQYESLRRSK